MKYINEMMIRINNRMKIRWNDKKNTNDNEIKKIKFIMILFHFVFICCSFN